MRWHKDRLELLVKDLYQGPIEVYCQDTIEAESLRHALYRHLRATKRNAAIHLKGKILCILPERQLNWSHDPKET